MTSYSILFCPKYFQIFEKALIVSTPFHTISSRGCSANEAEVGSSARPSGVTDETGHIEAPSSSASGSSCASSTATAETASEALTPQGKPGSHCHIGSGRHSPEIKTVGVGKTETQSHPGDLKVFSYSHALGGGGAWIANTAKT